MKKKWLLIIGGLLFVFILIGSSGDSPSTENEVVIKEDELNLKTDEKKKIYFEVVLAEDKGQKEADKKYPTSGDVFYNSGIYKDEILLKERIQNNIDLADELQEKYRNEVLKRFNLTYEKFRSFSMEAVKNDWPMPEYN